MPTYRTRTAGGAAKKKKRKYPKRLPRDHKKMYRWAALGTVKDYEKLRDLAAKARHSLPAHIDGVAFERIIQVDRLRMIEEIQAAEQHDISAGFFMDGLNWLLDKIPWGNWLWPVSAAQSSINSQKGDGLNEVDEQYPARGGDLRDGRGSALRDRSLETAGGVRQRLHQRVTTPTGTG